MIMEAYCGEAHGLDPAERPPGVEGVQRGYRKAWLRNLGERHGRDYVQEERHPPKERHEHRLALRMDSVMR